MKERQKKKGINYVMVGVNNERRVAVVSLGTS